MQDKDTKNLEVVVDDVATKTTPAQERGAYALAEEVTGLKRSTLQSKVCRQEIPHTRLGKRLVSFSRAELVAWMKERAVPVKAVS